MSTQRTIILRFDDSEFEQLEAAARRSGVAADVLVRSIVDDVLRNEVLDNPEQRRQATLNALRSLDKLAATMPDFDAESLVRQGRDDLEERSIF